MSEARTPKDRLLQCAHYYIKQGWPIFPVNSIVKGKCTCGKATCKHQGKHPYASHAPNGLKNATTDRGTVDQWFGDGKLNIGIRTGKESGLVVVDIDPRHGGDESIKGFEVPDTLTVNTGGGGKHHYFKHPGFKVPNSEGKIADGIDVRGDGGYVLAPPSNHLSGGNYGFHIDPRGCE